MEIRKHILVVDDTDTTLFKLEQSLKSKFQLTLASSGMQALQLLEKITPDIILLDVKMPEMDGYETFKRIHKNKKLSEIPVIFMASDTSNECEYISLEIGGSDFVRKPVQRDIIIKRINNQLKYRNERMQIDRLVESKIKEFENLQDILSMGFAEIVESRDGTTGEHIKNTTRYVQVFVNEIAKFGYYNLIMTEDYIKSLVRAAPLHDMGKIGISDEVLLKGEALSREEFELMKTHTIIGGEVLQNMLYGVKDITFLKVAKDMALFHHERWDGTGYPLGLKDDEIPLSARILSIVDVYDALTSKRPYKRAYSHKEAFEFIIKHSGIYFDPLLVEVFLQSEDKIIECYNTRVDNLGFNLRNFKKA